MKILEANIFDSIIGGTESYLANLALALKNDGHELLHFFLKISEGGEGLVPGVPRWYFPHLSPQHFTDFFRFHRSPEVKKEIREFKRLLQSTQPDIIHLNNIYTPFYLRKAFGKIPSLRTVHDYRFVCPLLYKLLPGSQGICPFPMGRSCFRKGCLERDNQAEIRNLFFLLHERELSRHFSGLIVKSLFVKETLVRNGFDPRSVHVLPLSTPIPAEVCLPPPPGRILFAGRLSPEKGIDLLFEVLGSLPGEIRLVIAGDGPERNRLENLAGKLGLRSRIEFKGWLSPPALGREYDQSTFLVIPSMWPEPFGLVGLEAMAHARPVVAFAVGGIPEWLEDNVNGFLVPRGDRQILSEKMNLLLADRELASRLGRNGRRIAEEKYSPRQNAVDLIKLFETVISR